MMGAITHLGAALRGWTPHKCMGTDSCCRVRHPVLSGSPELFLNLALLTAERLQLSDDWDLLQLHLNLALNRCDEWY